MKAFSTLVIATPDLIRGKQSRAARETLWIAASPTAPRNDGWTISLEGSVG